MVSPNAAGQQQQTYVTPGSTKAANAISSRLPKLDGVIYHFYSRTSAVITSCRLTHFDGGNEVLTGSSTTSSKQLQQLRRTSSESATGNTSANVNRTNSVSSTTSKRSSKWFALEIDDQDVFREEVRLWRSISTLIPDWLLEQPPSALPYQGPAYIPPMIIDVILDTSNLTTNHVLMIDELQEDNRTKRRVRADGQNAGVQSRRSSGPIKLQNEGQQEHRSEEEALDKYRHSIILESWRLDFVIHNPLDPPDLPTLYKHATAHFREMYGFVREMPSFALHKRLKQIWENNLERRKIRAQHTLNQNHLIDEDQDEEDQMANLLKVGVRMAIAGSNEVEKGHVGLREPLGSMTHRENGNEGITKLHSFAPILSSIGSLNLSVEYRRNVDFYVEDWHVIQSMREIALDEDYFKPTMARHIQRRESIQRQQQSSPQPSTSGSSTSSSMNNKGRSLLSQTQQQQRQYVTIEQGSTESSAISKTSSQPIPTSVFASPLGTSSGKPVAGLSNLRASPSVAGYSASPTATTLGSLIPGSGTSSPALAAALASDAAFLTHGRRPSSGSGDRRLRSFTNLSNTSSSQDKESPPSPSVLTTTTTMATGRPILTRSSAGTFPRSSGSYSPSSPSPLAQQLYAQQAAAAGLQNVNSQIGRFSSSPSFRGGLVYPSGAGAGSFTTSIGPNLRSVFQSHTPSQSQTSISSLSKTPPKSLLEMNPNSAISSRSNDAQQHSGSSFTTGNSAQRPTVAPQMIKRYSSTFNYRQNRNTTSLGSETGSMSGVQGAGSGSLGTGAGLYSRSWQSRIEQRQMFTPRSLGRGEDGSTYSANSPLSRRRPSITESIGQDDELDELVRMIESKPSLNDRTFDTSDSRDSQLARQNVDDAEIARRKKEADAIPSDSISPMNNRLDNTTINRSSPLLVSSDSSAIPRTYGVNRSQIDEMLHKMQTSVREFSTSLATSRSSPASGGHATSSSGGQSQPEHSPPVQYYGLSGTSFTRSPLSRGSYSAASPMTKAGNVDLKTGNVRSTVPMEAIASGDGMDSRIEPVLPSHQGHTSDHKREVSTKDTEISNTVAKEDDEDDGMGDGRNEARMSRSHPGRTQSRGSLELYGPHSYDPLDDEAAGRLELAHDDDIVEESIGGQHPSSHIRQNIHGMNATATGIIHSNNTNNNNNGNQPVPTEEEYRRRRTNMELARNFTNSVSNRGGNGRSTSSTTGTRTGMSPWRQRGFHPAPAGSVMNTSPGEAQTSLNSQAGHHNPYHLHHIHGHQSHFNASRNTGNNGSGSGNGNGDSSNRSSRSNSLHPSSPP